MAKSVILPIVSTIDNRGIQSAIGQLNSLGNSMRNVGRAIAGSLIVNKVGQFMADSAVQARDYERNMIALSTVFDEFTPQMERFVASAGSFGQSQADAAKSATFLGSVLKQSGLPMSEVANQTERLTKLASDLATTYGYDVPEALTGMTALFRGEYDPIEKFGVAMKQSEVNAVLAANGQSKLQGAARRNAEQIARLALLYDRSRDAQGAFERGNGTLFVEQMKLIGSVKDLQKDLGQALLPTLVEIAQALVPLVQSFLPLLKDAFAQVGESLKTMLANRTSFSAFLATMIDGFTQLFKIVSALAPVFLSNINFILGFTIAYKGLSSAFSIVTGAVTLYRKAIDMATASTVAMNIASTRSPWGLIATGLATVIGLVLQLNSLVAESESTPSAMVRKKAARQASIAADKAYTATLEKLKLEQAKAEASGLRFDKNIFQEAVAAKNAAYQQAYQGFLQVQAEQSRYQAMATVYNGRLQADAEKSAFDKMLEEILKGVGNVTDGLNKGGAQIAKAQQSVAQMLREEAAKQAYKSKLSGLGASEGLIEQILGTQNWWKNAQSIVKSGAGFVSQLQALFNQTADGLAEISKKQQAAAEEAAAKAEAAKNLIDSALSGFASTDLLALGVKQVGEYQTAIKSLFDNIKSALSDGLANKTLTQSAFAFLSDYATKQVDILQEKARAIDILTKKIEIARSTTSSILSSTSITSALQTETSQVTESFKMMRDGIEITVSKTVDAVKNNNLPDAYRKLVEKTKTFAKNLASLKALGINPMLFKQILEAGADAGGAVAQAIVDGGSSTVDELNGLFGELDSAASSIAAESTDLLYGLGEETTNGFISGLLAQKDALVAAADELVKAFEAAFRTQLNIALGMNAGAISNGVMNGGWAADVTATNMANYNAFRRSEQAPVTVNVNANVVKSDAELGLVVYDAIQAARRSGVVGAGVI